MENEQSRPQDIFSTDDYIKKDEQESVVADQLDLYRQRQRDILEIELHKTSNLIFIIAALLLGSNVLGVILIGIPFSTIWLDVLLIPAIVGVFGFVAVKEPLAAAILATLVIFGVWTYNYIQLGKRSVISGWLIKAIVIYLLAMCFQHARLAHKIKHELK